MIAPEAEIRAAEKVLAGAVRNPVTGCLEVTCYRNADGYGQVGAGGRTCLAHRLVMTALSGVAYADAPAPITRHLCDHPPCVNPLHLRFGTQAQNTRDSIEAGTHFAAGLRARTHCLRGHALAGANLKPYDLALGRRSCQVCARALVLRDHAKKRGQDAPLAHLIASELARTDGGRDLVARDALAENFSEVLAPPAHVV